MLASLSWMDVSLKDRDREAVSGILDIGRRPLQSRKRLRIPVFTFSWWERWFWLTRLVATYFIELGKKKKREKKNGRIGRRRIFGIVTVSLATTIVFTLYIVDKLVASFVYSFFCRNKYNYIYMHA